MRKAREQLIVFSLALALINPLRAQSPAATSAAPRSSTAAELEQRLEKMSSDLALTHQQLLQSQQEMEQMREELAQIKALLTARQPEPAAPQANGQTTAAAIEDLQERQQTTEAQVKVHDQIKVESSSKYPVRVTGLILFNSFINRGTVDEIDLPETALNNQGNTTGNGSIGASFRQTILGLLGYGPKIAGAQTSAYVDLDFFGGLAYNSYATTAGIVRMRSGNISLDWTNDSVQVGLVTPLISPLSPSSFATVAEPALAGAGNLWAWAPELRYTHRIPLQSGKRVQVEFGLWDPPTAGYNANTLVRVPSPGEASQQPGYETRLSYGSYAGEHPFQLGVSGYYSRQSYPNNQSVDSWAGTADWRIPFGERFEISGEGYRGQALGGLGGGVYKDVLVGTYDGVNYYRGLNAIGGWTQFKSRFTRSLEANAAIGLDDGFAGDFHSITFPANATAVQLRARNKMVIGNLIFRPKTYLIFSPEYRRIWTWPIAGPGSTADIFTLSAGYQF